MVVILEDTVKTIVFHSYKGGVGRTLTLANLGYALSRMGKKVVLLDLDVDAPSLHSKFEQDRKVRGGYINYLKEYYEPIEDKSRAQTVVYEAMKADIKECSDSLRKYTIDISNNLKLIPAGDPSQPMYWWNLGSTWLHFLLSLTREEINKVENGYSIYNTVSRKFLQRELEVIKALYPSKGADYLIVDCRSPREYSSVALIFWADIVVSMFNSSLDGLKGLVNIHHFVRRARSGDPKSKGAVRPRIIPVLCRVPEDFADESANQLQEAIMADWAKIQIPFGPALEPPEQFATLHEFRDLEQTERLLLHHQPTLPKSAFPKVRDIDVKLSHDYVELFCQIFAIEEDVVKGVPLREAKIWNRVFGLTKNVTLERTFPILGSGVMLNRDNERNVALRANSILIWFNSGTEFYASDLRGRGVGESEIDRALRSMVEKQGYDWGSDFGRELTQLGRVLKSTPANVADILTAWCKYDHAAGFGRMTCTYNASSNSGRIIWKDSFLHSDQKPLPHATEFACGYIRGILKNVLPVGKGHLSVKPMTKTVFAFSWMVKRNKSDMRRQVRE